MVEQGSSTANLYAVTKLPTPTLSVLGSEKKFPVRRVYCVGSNYRFAYVPSTFLWRGS